MSVVSEHNSAPDARYRCLFRRSIDGLSMSLPTLRHFTDASVGEVPLVPAATPVAVRGGRCYTGKDLPLQIFKSMLRISAPVWKAATFLQQWPRRIT